MNRSTLYKVEVMKAYLEGTPISVNGNKPVTKPTQIEWNWVDNDYTIYEPEDTTVYPALFKHDSGIVAEFSDATTAMVIDSGTTSMDVGYVFTSSYPCTDTTRWIPFEYPVIFKHTQAPLTVEFSDLTSAKVLASDVAYFKVGEKLVDIIPHTDTDTWAGPIEAPTKAPTEIVLEEWLLEADGDYIIVETSNITEFTDEITTAVKLLSTRTIILD